MSDSDKKKPPDRLFKQLFVALERLHEKSIAHRDLKPDNIFVSHDQQLTVLDFGVALVGARRFSFWFFSLLLRLLSDRRGRCCRFSASTTPKAPRPVRRERRRPNVQRGADRFNASGSPAYQPPEASAVDLSIAAGLSRSQIQRIGRIGACVPARAHVCVFVCVFVFVFGRVVVNSSTKTTTKPHAKRDLAATCGLSACAVRRTEEEEERDGLVCDVRRARSLPVRRRRASVRRRLAGAAL